MDLIKKLITRAKESGISERELCRNLEIDPGNFNRWKNGGGLPPDPRKEENKIVYANIAKFLGVSLGQALYESIFPLSTDGRVKFFKIDKERVREIPPIVQQKLLSIGKNLHGNNELIDIIIDFIKSYKKHVKKEEWID